MSLSQTYRFFCLAGLILAASPAVAQQGVGESRSFSPKPSQVESAPADKAVALSPAKQLEQMFERLKAAKTPAEAKTVATLIARRWVRSGSDTVDLVMARMQRAAQAGDFNLALELADRAIALEPDWAESRNQRAILFLRMGDMTRAVFDLAEALKREPRHFAAMAALASLLQQQGNAKAALKIYREALALYPLMEGVKQAVERLTPEVEGRDA